MAMEALHVVLYLLRQLSILQVSPLAILFSYFCDDIYPHSVFYHRFVIPNGLHGDEPVLHLLKFKLWIFKVGAGPWQEVKGPVGCGCSRRTKSYLLGGLFCQHRSS